MDLCDCRYKPGDPPENISIVLMTTTPMIVEVEGNSFPTL